MIVQTATGNRVVTQARDILDVWNAPVAILPPGVRGSSTNRGFFEKSCEDTAVACAVRLVSESIGSMVARVFTGDGMDRQPDYEAPQAAIFQNPTAGVSSFDFWSDIASGVELGSASFAWKLLDRRGQLVELLPLDPEFFQITGPPAQRRVVGWRGGSQVDVTADVVVVRGWSPKAAADGVSTPNLHKSTLDYATSYATYTGRWFELDGTVSQVIEKGPSTRAQRLEMAAGWMRARRDRNVGMLWGDAQLKQMGSTLQDAQAAQIELGIVQRVARAWRIQPASFLLATVSPERYPNLEVPTGLFFRLSLLHRIRRIERALSADRDVFPNPSMYMRFDATEFLRADLATLANLAHNMRQDGSVNADEERAFVLGWPPLPDGQGQHVQVTPVGGGENPGLTTPPAADASGDISQASFDHLLSRNGDSYE